MTVAVSERLSAIRAVPADLAAHTGPDITLDTLADVRMALAEARAMLVERAVPDGDLVCHFTVSGDLLTLTARTRSAHHEPVDRTSFA